MKWIVFFALACSSALASEALQTNSFSEVFERIEREATVHGRAQVLVVLDIDNTLLRMANDLGSDQWYSWQEEIMKEENCSPACITRDPAKLLDYQGLLFAIGKMVATEPTLAERINALQRKGQKIVLLTSRGHDFRSVTERALAQNGFNFRSSQMGSSVAETYLPYDLARAADFGLTQEEVEAARLQAPRPVSYQNGIYMTAGQNKGVMLKTLLHKYGARFKAVIFVDDHQRHVDRMQAIVGDELDLTTYRYGGVDAIVTRFKESDKSAVSKNWQKLQDTLKEIGYN